LAAGENPKMGKPKKMKTNGKRRKPEQIVKLLIKAEADISSGFTVEDVCRDIGVADFVTLCLEHLSPLAS